MKTSASILLLALGTFIVSPLFSQPANCYIRKTYPAPKGTTLQLSNKYGDVNIITSKKDSLFVCATVTIDQTDTELAAKNVRLISIDIRKMNDIVSITTSYDKAFFSPANRSGRKSFRVDILIETPAWLNADIVNSFGNISIGELSGKANIKLSYGDLNAMRLTRGNSDPINSIAVDYGNISIEETGWLSLVSRNCPSVDISKAQALSISSAFSKISIGEASSLVADSKSDSYTIDSIKNIVANSRYSEFNIDKLYGKLSTKAEYGSINISGLNREFTGMDIVSDYSPVKITTGADVSFRAELSVTNANLDLSEKDNPGISKTVARNTTTVTGFFGKNRETASYIKILSKGGNISVNQ